MRANTPAKPLGVSKPLPQPKFKIGDEVIISLPENFTRKYARHLVGKTSKIINKLRRCGYLSPDSKLPDKNKEHIRSCIKAVLDAHIVQIIGIVPWSMYNIDTTLFNECYIGGVTRASSPVQYLYHILIRFKNSDGNDVAMITGIPVGMDDCFKLLKG